MSACKNKNILIGVTGSIAAYKAAELIRLVKEAGANVKVVMTKDAKEFITELTLQAVSGSPVHCNLLDPNTEASMSHITLAKWADLLLIVPATANVIAKLKAGLADDLLSTLYLACAAPTVIVPAMNQQMWRHAATQANVAALRATDVTFWGPDTGSQACGDVGPGRMLEPVEILAQLEHFFSPKLLEGKKVLITAGPTRERIDPVRYISNYSSGKMGYALAQSAQALGANVTLVTGPTHLQTPDHIKTVAVESAQEMYQAVMDQVAACDIFIACAAVADYRSATVAKQKIKKPSLPQITLENNVDILKEVASLEKRPYIVGFAAETENLIDNAKKKLHEKKLDMIVANLIGESNSGFESDDNRVCVITATNEIDFELMSKRELAPLLLELIQAAL
jgi:phosphopantothenoylcysteine decarboxylase/phosphopantothenate--cysteine ligase